MKEIIHFIKTLKPPEDKNITINGPVTGSSIVQGDNNNLNITFDFLTKLEKEIKNSSLSQEEKKTWLSRIKEISTHPIIASLVTNVIGNIMK